MWMSIAPDSCFCSAMFFGCFYWSSVTNTTRIIPFRSHHYDLILFMSSSTRTAHGYSVHPCSRWSYKKSFSPLTCLLWAWSIFSQYLQGKEEREDREEHHCQSHHPSVFAGFFSVRGWRLWWLLNFIQSQKAEHLRKAGSCSWNHAPHTQILAQNWNSLSSHICFLWQEYAGFIDGYAMILLEKGAFCE